MKWYFIRPIFSQKLIWPPTRFCLEFFGRIEIRGMEKLDKIRGNVIFASNHISEGDPFVIPGTLPFFSRFSPIFYMARENRHFKDSKFSWRRYFYGGFIFRSLGSFPVISGFKDYKISLAPHLKIIRDGGSICVYPEGGITPDGNFQPAHGGVAYLAYTTKRPIIPVRLRGFYGISLKDFFLRRHGVSVTYGDPIYPKDIKEEDITPEECRRFAEEVMERIKKL